jgi:hypothetical protein
MMKSIFTYILQYIRNYQAIEKLVENIKLP